MNDAPIGVFDSGLGGLTVWSELRRRLPRESLLYYGDGKNCPYGDKTREQVTEAVDFAVRRLVDRGVKLIVVACNAATAMAIDHLRAAYPIPFVGLEPAVKPAALSSRSGVIGILATAATLRGKLFRETSRRYEDRVRIIARVGEGFVELVERNRERTEEAYRRVERLLMPMIEAGADRIVLGCTHYPFLSEAMHRVIGDRIEAGTFIVAGALMADERGVDVTGFCPIHLGMVLKKMELMGIECERIENGVHVNRAERIKPVDIQTLPFPGFPTDMQAQIMVLSALADGSSVITENIFENRFMFASELVRMGADIRIESHHAMIHGVKGFSGAQVTSPDLRGGAALVVAGLIADGVTEVSAIHHIKRGYEQFVEKLQALGAHVEHATVPDPVIY